MHPTAPAWLIAVFSTLTVLVAAVFVGLQTAAARRRGEDARAVGLRTAVLVVAWLALTGALGASGALLRFDARPPPFAFMLLATAGAGIGVGVSSLGTRLVDGLPLWALVLWQSFRLPLELVMHRAADVGTMPSVMTWTGRNFDVLTGISAILVAVALRAGAPRWIAAIWNALGLGLLVNVVAVAVAASPLLRYFGEGQLNTWVAYAPFVWLPTVMVASALAGHVVVARALVRGGRSAG